MDCHTISMVYEMTGGEKMSDNKKVQSNGKQNTDPKKVAEKSGEQMKRSSQTEKSGVRAIGGA